ncbi:MAG: hypothetical protein PSV35_00530 [bacterium]|nr:hypothetical protein [bacterium]
MHKATPSFIWGLLIWGINSPDFAISYNPEKVFPITVNPIKPSSFWLDNKKPFPTNAWFTNFVLLKKQSEFSDPVNIFPYLVRISNAGISLSYSAPIYYANPLFPKIVSAFYYQFENQISLGAVEQFDDYGVASYHGLAVNLEWRNKHLQKINAPIVQGSPYLSEFFTRATPQILSRFKWIAVNSHTQSGPLPLSKLYLECSPRRTTINSKCSLYGVGTTHFTKR